MARWQGLSRRTKSGARIKKHHEKRKAELGRHEAETIIGESRVRSIRTRGGNIKLRAYRYDYCNLSDPETRKTERVKIIDVETNPANKEYTRRKVMTKGALIRTEKGYAVITNRPGQEGFISAIPTKFDVQQTQQRTLSVKKKKRRTLQLKRIGSTSGTQKKTTTKEPATKTPLKPKEKVIEKPVLKEEETTIKKQQPATSKIAADATDEAPTAVIEKEIIITYKGRNYSFDKKITIADLKEKKAPNIVKDKVAEVRAFKSWK